MYKRVKLAQNKVSKIVFKNIIYFEFRVVFNACYTAILSSFFCYSVAVLSKHATDAYETRTDV